MNPWVWLSELAQLLTQLDNSINSNRLVDHKSIVDLRIAPVDSKLEQDIRSQVDVDADKAERLLAHETCQTVCLSSHALTQTSGEREKKEIS